MADIAEIGFSVNTGELDKAEKSLDKIKAAAGGVSGAINRLTQVVEGMSNSMMKAARSVAQMENLKAVAILESIKARNNATNAEIKAAEAVVRYTRVTSEAISRDIKRSQSLQKVAQAQMEVNKIATVATAKPSLVVNNGRSVKPGQPANDQMPNRFNTGNIAAQFQDIGVTASMGMNPLLIAMQQGTQLSAILNSMEKPLIGLGIALKSVFNTISLLSIGIVALVVAGIQMINWTNVAKSALNGIANAIDAMSKYIQIVMPYVLGLGAALILWYSPAIIAGIYTLSISIIALGASALSAGLQMAAAWLIGMGPIGWVIAGIIALSAAFAAFGGDAVGYMKIAANGIIGSLVGAYNTVLATWKILPAAMGSVIIETTNVVLSGINNMINAFVGMINNLMGKLPESIRPKGDVITWKMNAEFANPFADGLAQYEKAAGEEFAKALKKDYVGAAGQAIEGLTKNITSGIRGFAASLGVKDGKDKKGEKTPEEKYDDIIRGADRKIASLKAERDAIGLTEFATAKLKFETELLNEAQQKNILLTNAGKLEIAAKAEQMAKLTNEIANNREELDFAKDVTKSFFSDMKQGLQEGKSMWETFGNAVSNILNKILDKMANSGIDMLFGGSGGAGGNGLGFLGSALNSLTGSTFGVQSAVDASISNPANAGFFAKGDAFTNNIVGKATPFAFANGGALGVMGEAGPEAVMPLHRGSDGSLGVKMSGGGGGDTIVAVNINNYGDAKVTTNQRQGANGMELDVMIDEMTANNISNQSSSTNRSLNINNNRRMISR